MATLAELEVQVRDLLGDPAAESNTFSPPQVKEAINKALLNYCDKTGVTYAETVIAVLADGLVTLPTDALTVERVFVN